jgi:hypothetical protein
MPTIRSTRAWDGVAIGPVAATREPAGLRFLEEGTSLIGEEGEVAVAKCVIWGTPAQEIPRLGDYEHLNSRRAGGEYKVTGSDLQAVRSLTEPEKKTAHDVDRFAA